MPINFSFFGGENMACMTSVGRILPVLWIKPRMPVNFSFLFESLFNLKKNACGVIGVFARDMCVTKKKEGKREWIDHLTSLNMGFFFF